MLATYYEISLYPQDLISNLSTTIAASYTCFSSLIQYFNINGGLYFIKKRLKLFNLNRSIPSYYLCDKIRIYERVYTAHKNHFK